MQQKPVGFIHSLHDRLFPFYMWLIMAIPYAAGWSESTLAYVAAIFSPGMIMLMMLWTSLRSVHPRVPMAFGGLVCIAAAPAAAWLDWLYRLQPLAEEALRREPGWGDAVYMIWMHGAATPWLAATPLAVLGLIGIKYALKRDEVWIVYAYDRMRSWWTGEPAYEIVVDGDSGSGRIFNINDKKALLQALPPGEFILGERRNPMIRPAWLLDWREVVPAVPQALVDFVEKHEPKLLAGYRLDFMVAAGVEAVKFLTRSRYHLTRILNVVTLPARYRGGVVDLIRFRADGHLLTVAGPGAGKSVSIAVPNLLMFNAGSVFCLDPKGELYAMTGRRRRELGNTVVLFNPRNLKLSHTYNILDFIDPMSPDCLSDCTAVATWLACAAPKKAGGGGDNSEYFQNMARQLMTSLLLHIVCGGYPKEKCNLKTLRELVSLPPEEMKTTLKIIYANQYRNGAGSTLVGTLLGIKDELLGSIISQANTTLDWLSSEPLAHLVSGNGPRVFKSADILSGKVSVYLCIDNQQLMQYPGVARVIIGSLMQTIMRAAAKAAAGDGKKSETVLFMLDEAKTLGYFTPLQEAFSLARGAGIRAWPIYQNFSQIKESFGEDGAKAITDGADVTTMMVISDPDEAKKVEEMIGEHTVRTTSYSANRQSSGTHAGVFSPLTRGTITPSYNTKAQPVVPKNKIMMLPPDSLIIRKRSTEVIFAAKCKYYEREDFYGLYSKNDDGKLVPDPNGTRMPMYDKNPYFNG